MKCLASGRQIGPKHSETTLKRMYTQVRCLGLMLFCLSEPGLVCFNLTVKADDTIQRVLGSLGQR